MSLDPHVVEKKDVTFVRDGSLGVMERRATTRLRASRPQAFRPLPGRAALCHREG